MTVQSENNIVRTEGDGSIVAFDYNFPIVSDDHLEVYLDGVLQGSGYTVTGVGDPNGGTVTFSVAPGDTVQVILRRFVPYTQLVDYITGDKFPADTHEAGLDLAMMAASQLQEQFDRTIRFPITSSATSSELPDPDDSDNWGKAYVLDSAGAGISMHPITGGGDIEVLTTKGDLVYHAGSSVTRLPLGSNYSKLISEITPKWKSQAVFYVSDLYTPDGVTDDYTSLQSILTAYTGTTPATIVFENGKTYNLSRSLVTHSNVILEGNGATLQALSGGFTGTAAANTSSLIRNYNHGYNNIPAVVNSFLDSNIVIRNFHMSFNGEAAAGQGNICIWFRYVDRYLIQDCTFGDSGDPVGILACRRGLIDHCYAEAFINAGYDHWDGCIDCGVTNSVLVSTLADTRQGIQFTGVGWDNVTNRDTIGCYAMFNKVYGIRNGTSNTASAIIFNANDGGSSTQNCISAFNYIEDADLGVVFSGAGSNNVSIGDVLKNVDQVPLFIQHHPPADPHSPDYCRFLDTTLIDCDSAGNALVTLSGTEPEVRGLKVINSGAAPYAYIVSVASTATDAAVSIQKAPDGTTGRILDAGTTSKIYGESLTYTPVLSFGGATTGITYTSRLGTYTRNGDVIHARGTIVVNDNGSASGGAAISLPTPASAVQLNGVMTCWLTGASGLTSNVIGLVTADGTVAALYDTGATGSVVIDENNIPNSCTISYDVTYRAVL